LYCFSTTFLQWAVWARRPNTSGKWWSKKWHAPTATATFRG